MYKYILYSVVFGIFSSACVGNVTDYGPKDCQEVDGFEICTATGKSVNDSVHRNHEEYALLLSVVAEVFDEKFPGAEANLKEEQLTIVAYDSRETLQQVCNINDERLLGCHNPSRIAVVYDQLPYSGTLVHEMIHHALRLSVGDSDGDHTDAAWRSTTEHESLEHEIHVRLSAIYTQTNN